ncbi:MAG: hypothetical protein JXC32_21095 [Anaerolineae bacterium]|nr:hypothetical protein [Anaerolineae bacterium]
MKTNVQIDGTKFLINGQPTYAGLGHLGRPIEGLLFNSRMVQAIFDDENPDTVGNWRYPDTGRWDPDRNTDEFCAMLPEYRRYGLLGVTVGLQGGGAIYLPEIYDHYVNSAFRPDGSLKPAYMDRLARILAAADEAGIVVIVNYFYWKQVQKMAGEAAIRRAAEEATNWLLETGYGNILVDVYNEFTQGDGLTQSARIHELIEVVQHMTLNGRRLLAGASVMPGNLLVDGRWQQVQDFYLPHGNDAWPKKLRYELQQVKASKAFLANPRPILINEDSMYVNNLEAAVDEYASWGFYIQGYGCGGWDHGRYEWTQHGRETTYEALTGYQTVPVNWSINTGLKRAFFYRLAEITQSPGVGA